MKDDILPCAWCGEKPVSTEKHHGRIIVDHCCDLQVVDFQHHDGWNACQERLIAARKLDFDAGRSIKNDEHGWIYIFQSFDDYIKEDA